MRRFEVVTAPKYERENKAQGRRQNNERFVKSNLRGIRFVCLPTFVTTYAPKALAILAAAADDADT